jgi:hypothetical protein
MKHLGLLLVIMFILIVVLLLAFYLLRGLPIKGSDDFIPAGINDMERMLLNKCQVPTLNSDKCFFTEYNECPTYNGSYMQCTNNYIPKPDQNNCKCNNRTFEMCPSPFKISEKCYYDNLGPV